MSFKDKKLNAQGNSDEWYCEGCSPRNDCHEDDCNYKDKPLMTEMENPRNNYAISPAFCKKCGCSYSNGCPEHPSSEQVKLSSKK